MGGPNRPLDIFLVGLGSLPHHFIGKSRVSDLVLPATGGWLPFTADEKMGFCESLSASCHCLSPDQRASSD